MAEMYTIYFYKYLERGYTTPSNINDFIELDIGGVTYNIKELFEKRNKYKEIGGETCELFKHNLEILIDEALAKYNSHLSLLQSNFNDLMKRTVTETTSGYTNTNTQNGDYLQPVNTNATVLQGLTKGNGAGSYNESRTRAFGFFKSNPEILKTAMEIEDTVNEILKYLDRAFIGIY